MKSLLSSLFIQFQTLTLTVSFALILVAENSRASTNLCALAIPNRPPVALKYKASAHEIAHLHKKYPKILELINQTLENIENEILLSTIVPISSLSEMKIVRGLSPNVSVSSQLLELSRTLPDGLQQEIVDVHNLFISKDAFKKYIYDLMNDVGVLMMKEADQLTPGRKKIQDPTSEKSSPVKKKKYLLAGAIDRNSLLRVLVNRAKSRGDKIGFIPKTGFSKNSTRSYKYSEFWDVPRGGPFFDQFFDEDERHGQETHLLQMDFAEVVLDPTRRRDFWDYATSPNQGSWVWDTLFDGREFNFREPEFISPLLQKTLPLH